MKMAIKKKKLSSMTYASPDGTTTDKYSADKYSLAATDDPDVEEPLKEGSIGSPRCSQRKAANYFLDKEKTFVMKHWFYLAGVWCTVVLLVLARGGKGADSMIGVEYCGIGYWFISALAIVLLFSVSLKVMFENVEIADQKQLCNYKFASGDVVWNRSTALKLCVGTILAGVVAGLIGIGGGMVIGPFLLDIGVLPQVSSAITATNVLLSSSTLAVLVIASGLVVLDEAVFFFFCCLVGAYLGKFYLGKVIRMYGRTSLIILMLGGVITTCVVVVFTMGAISWATTDALQEDFTGVCT